MELNEFFSLAKERDFKVTRVHTHPHGSFLLCYDKNKWEDGFESIVKSSMNVPEFCIQQESFGHMLSNFELPEIPKRI